MANKESVVIPVERLVEEPFSQIIAYPSPTVDVVKDRIIQLRNLGVRSLDFHGSLKIDQVSILGKGVAGLVAAGLMDSKRVAVKIRRVDSRRHSMAREALMIRAANQARVGPAFLGESKDFLLMELLDAQRLPVWLSGLQGKGRRALIRRVLRNIFDQAVRLDSHGLDHGELSRAHKNVLVSQTGDAWIVDFESASQMRRANNFTSIAQYFFLGRVFARKVARLLGPVDRETLLDHLRSYKAGRTSEAYDRVQKMLKL
ncbi:MAG TPA: hypothetical protein VFE98_01450 [Candidatus Bathyarchaeia archaeon]|nr:hypothetical protein [Candidatus Bathyarchaeia archaeon]